VLQEKTQHTTQATQPTVNKEEEVLLDESSGNWF